MCNVFANITAHSYIFVLFLCYISGHRNLPLATKEKTLLHFLVSVSGLYFQTDLIKMAKHWGREFHWFLNLHSGVSQVRKWPLLFPLAMAQLSLWAVCLPEHWPQRRLQSPDISLDGIWIAGCQETVLDYNTCTCVDWQWSLLTETTLHGHTVPPYVKYTQKWKFCYHHIPREETKF